MTRERSTVLALDFARNLKRLRKREGLTQSQLAVRAGMVSGSRAFICDLEKGRRDPQLIMVERLAQAMGVEPREMFRRSKR